MGFVGCGAARKIVTLVKLVHPGQIHVARKAVGIAGRRIAEARRGTTTGPEGCGQEVRN